MTLKTMRPEPYLKNGLIKMCDHVNTKTEVVRALEVGSYLGESTIIFAQNFSKLKELIAVDPYSLIHNSDNLFDDRLILEIYETFLKNIEPYQQIKHLKLSSNEAAEKVENNTFDFIYIDGCHQYQSVLQDINNWKPKVKKGGFIAFHDVDNEQVKSALSNHFDLTTGFVTEDNSITFEVLQ